MTAGNKTQYFSKEDNRIQNSLVKMCRMQLKIPNE